MPLRLRPLPSPARLKRKPEGDWLVAMHWPSPPRPGLKAYRLSCLPASPSRRPAFPKGFFRALPSPESSFPLSCGGGEPHSQDSLSSPPTPPDSPPSYHAALQSHKQPENIICPLEDPEDAKISEHTLYPRLLPQGKTDHMSPLGCACLLALQPPRQRSVCTFMKPIPPMIWMHSSVTFQAAS